MTTLTADMLTNWQDHCASTGEVHAAYALWRASVAYAGGVPFDPVAPASTYRTALAYRILFGGWRLPGVTKPVNLSHCLSVLSYASEGRISHLLSDPAYESFDDVHAAMLAGYAMSDYAGD